MIRNLLPKYISIIVAIACIGIMSLPKVAISAYASSVSESVEHEEELNETNSEPWDKYMHETEARSTDVPAASEGCVLVTIEGTFEETEANQVLERLNEIRYEACVEGVMNPKNGEPLTLDDYVPLKWSTDLENRALTRAAEASLLADHTRPNGQSCFTFVDSGLPATNETLAWGYGSIVESVNGWYTEKEAYVDDTSDPLLAGVTSHYVALINPDNLYVGAADFVIDGQRDACAAEFTAEISATVNEEQVGSYGLFRQQIEIKAEDLALTHIKGRSFVGTGSSPVYETALVYVGDDGADQLVAPVDMFIYTSSDESVLTFSSAAMIESGSTTVYGPAVSGVGTGYALREGEIVITVSIAGAPETLSVEKTVEVSDDIAENAGWNETEKGLQYRKASGALITDKWLKIDGEWYRLDKDGYAQVGWYSEDGQWYYFDEDGAMVRDWVASDGKWYYMSPTEGKLQIGWVEFKGRWYYLSVQKGGAMQTGWIESEGATYYLAADGARVTGEVQIEGKTYLFGDDGKLKQE